MSLFAVIASVALTAEPRGHGPSAPLTQFVSHRFQLEAHQPGLQLAFHAGLLQPLFVQGFNAAMDVRVGRFVATYSHGEGLDGVGRTALLPSELARGADLGLTWSNGGGLGVTLIDELYVLVDFKVHRYAFTAGPRCNHGKGVRHDRKALTNARSLEVVEQLLEKRRKRWREPKPWTRPRKPPLE
jgi:hypothetical protein